MRRWLIFCVLVLALASACARSSAPSTSPSGIEGRTLAGPTCPVERADSPCPDNPIAAEVRVLRDGREVTRFKTGDDGEFRVSLDPGTYTLDPVSKRPFPFGRPETVTVEAGRYTHVDVTFDTGIR